MRRLSILLALALLPVIGPAAVSSAHAGTAALAAGSLQADFNNDGFIDVAVGAPFEDIGGIVDAGSVNVLYGSSTGLTGAGGQQFWQGAGGVQGAAEEGDLFGFSLASGDFDNDGFADLAIGVPFEAIGGTPAAGAINVLFGSGNGLTGTNSQLFWQGAGDGGVTGNLEAGDLFGFSLSAGDFNGNGFDDLAVGLVGEDIGGIIDAGSVNILPGSASGLTGAGSQQFWQGDGLPGMAEDGDSLGFSLVSGDFDNDGFADLAAGAPFEAIGAIAFAGAVNVAYGTGSGLNSAGSQVIWQGNAGVAGMPETADLFGAALGAGDFNNDRFAELAIGAPNEAVGALDAAGAVNIVRGSSNGLTGASSQQFWQGSGGISGMAEAGDQLGGALASGDFNNDGFADLGIGVVGEDVGSVADAGLVNVLRGSGSGLTSNGSQAFAQGTGGLAGNAETGDGLGFSLAAGDFNNDNFVDLTAGVPFEAIGAIPGAGLIDVARGSGGGLTGTGSVAFWQGAAGVPGNAEVGDLFGFSLVGGDVTSASATAAASAGSAGSSSGSSAALSRLLSKAAGASTATGTSAP